MGGIDNKEDWRTKNRGKSFKDWEWEKFQEGEEVILDNKSTVTVVGQSSRNMFTDVTSNGGLNKWTVMTARLKEIEASLEKTLVNQELVRAYLRGEVTKEFIEDKGIKLK